MSESIGSLYSTKIPSLSETADIQEALRLYHYGAPSGTGSGQYDPTNTTLSNLVNPSIAYSLYNLQTQITSISGSLGVQSSNWTAKGVLVTATAASTLYPLTVGTNGQILTANSATSTGLQWATPLVTDVNSVTLSNKTLLLPKISSGSSIADANGNPLIAFPSVVTSPVNYFTINNTATTGTPSIVSTGTDANISLNLVSKGTGTVKANGLDIVTVSGAQTLLSKTLTGPTISSLYISDYSIVFEGAAGGSQTTLTITDPTATRTITLPDATGTVITTGNLSSITTVGTVTAGSFPVANLTGTTLPSTVVSSSLTSVGTLVNLTVTNPISGSVTGSAGSVAAANLTGTTLASVVTASSLISFGTSPTINTPTLTLSTTGSTTEGSISWDTTNKKIQVGGTLNGTTQSIDITPSTLNISTPTFVTNAYTAALTDKDKWLELSNGATAGTFYINIDATVNFPIGTQINIIQTGTGQITIAPTASATTTINATPGLKLRSQWSSATIIKRAANLWVVVGDLVA
jgi:hypothetical protein